ncbi:MAG: recombinase family protein [Anaerolineae bacterium]
MTTKVAVYCRVSTEWQKEDGTIAVQVDAIKQWANRHPEFDIFGWYLDEGYSGDTHLEQRPRGADLLRDLNKGGIGAVVVWKADRLFRDNRKFMLFAWAIQEQGVKIISITEPFDMDTMEGELVGFMYSLFGKKERLAIKERMAGGKLLASKAGKWVYGKCPFGYKIVNGYLVIHPENAQWVGRIFEWYVNGMGSKWIVYKLNENGVLSSRDKREYWQPCRITKVISNPAYKGEATVTIKGHGPVTIPTPPLVSVEMWENAQLVREDRYCHGRRNPKFILRGKIVCGLCGRGFTGTNGGVYPRRYRYYKCNGPRCTPPIKCTAPIVRAEELETAVWRQIEQFLYNPGEAINLLIRSQGDAKEELSRVDTDLGEVDRGLIRLETRRKEAISLAMDGVISRDDLRIQLADIERDKGRLEEHKGQLKERQASILHGEAEAEQARQALEDIREGLAEEPTLEDKAYLVGLLVKRVVVNRGEDGKPDVDVTLRFGVTNSILGC